VHFTAVVADKTVRTAVGEETKSRVIFFDDGSLEQLGISELEPLEQGLSCCTCVFDAAHGDAAGASADTVSMAGSSSGVSGTGTAPSARAQNPQYFVVGTAHVVSGELEPSRGRILVFEIAENRRVHLIAEKEVKGAVFSVAQVCGRLVAGIGSKVRSAAASIFLYVPTLLSLPHRYTCSASWAGARTCPTSPGSPSCSWSARTPTRSCLYT
jgi:hypothetical protein